MGQACISEEDQIRLENLRTSLEEQEEQNIILKEQLEAERERYRVQKKGLEDITSEKLQQLSNEKKQSFKAMLKEKKRKTRFEDEVEEYKKRIKTIEDSINTLKFEKEEKAKKEKEEEERKAQEAERQRKEEEERKAQEAAMTRGVSIRSKKNHFEMAGLGHIAGALDSIKMPDLGGMAIKSLDAVVSAPGKGMKGIGKGVQGIGKGVQGIGKGVQEIGKLTGKGIDKLVGRDTSVTNESQPFRVKESESENDSEYSDDDGSHSDDLKYQVLETKETLILDIGFDVESEIAHVHSWLYKPPVDPNKKEDVKQLKHRLASLLTHRSEKYREQLVVAFYEEYGKRLPSELKKIMIKGNALHIINALLMTRAQYDAVLISGYISEWDIEPVADIICCRNMKQLKELHAAFKAKCKGNVKKQLQALAQKEKKRTLVKVIGKMFDFKRKEKVKVDVNRVNKDTNFILTTKSFKNEKKERLVLIFCANSVQYIQVLNDQFLLKSKDSLTTFIDKKLGPKSTVGCFCKIRIEYALDAPVYYAKLIKKLGVQFKKNQTKIGDIFVQRIEIDLDLIQRTWKMKKFGDGKSLKEWVVAKCGKGSSSGKFLSKMLDECPRYVGFAKQQMPTIKGGKLAKMMMT